MRLSGKAKRKMRREIRQEVGFDHREGKTSVLKVRGMTDNYVSDSQSEMIKRPS